METKLKLFNEKKIRTVWNPDEEDWYFSVVDVVAVLTDSDNPQIYWRVLKKRLKDEGNETVTNCNGLKMRAADGKMRMTDALNTKGILRLVQSIPSPKAEPFKMWLAQIGSERLDEIAAPEKAIIRAQNYYRQTGYSEEWIRQRMSAIEARKNLTNEWQARGVESDQEFAILTNDITKAWSGLSVKEYKELKDLKKENLRDNMTDMELVLTSLAELTTIALSQKEKPQTMEENRQIAKQGGGVAGSARKSVEEVLGHSVVSPLNATDKDKLLTRKMKEIPETNEEK